MYINIYIYICVHRSDIGKYIGLSVMPTQNPYALRRWTGPQTTWKQATSSINHRIFYVNVVAMVLVYDLGVAAAMAKLSTVLARILMSYRETVGKQGCMSQSIYDSKQVEEGSYCCRLFSECLSQLASQPKTTQVLRSVSPMNPELLLRSSGRQQG